MPTYVAFLRAINLGAIRKFPKNDLRLVVEARGFADVDTYINTGNIRFRTAMRSLSRIEAALEAAFLADRGFPVPTIVFPLSEVAHIAADTAELSQRHPAAHRAYVDLLRDPLPFEAAARVEATSSAAAIVTVRGRAVHTLLDLPVGPGLDPSPAQPVDLTRLLGVTTNRNANVIRTIAERWC